MQNSKYENGEGGRVIFAGIFKPMLEQWNNALGIRILTLTRKSQLNEQIYSGNYNLQEMRRRQQIYIYSQGMLIFRLEH